MPCGRDERPDTLCVKMEGARRVGSQVALMREFVRRKLEVWPEFVAALVVGSIAHGEARSDSDVECVLVFDPLDEAIVPAEFVWVPATDNRKPMNPARRLS